MLAVLGQRLVDLQDVLLESHVQHAVSLVQDEVVHAREVGLLQVEQRDEAAWGGDDDVGALVHAAALLLPGDAVGTAIDGYGGDGEEVGEALDLLLDLYRQLARGGHDEGIHLGGVAFATA